MGVAEPKPKPIPENKDEDEEKDRTEPAHVEIVFGTGTTASNLTVVKRSKERKGNTRRIYTCKTLL
ncbi:hypothetical protein BPOR_0402g00090 [Botrytis porri]|uniref:Uncharacterized protein n=1 Tax=Botrytis porri TaxID=87229 RepID=A0A4Z1KH14_9HELO|nr:hypothetical protein BPOR_0402g00090 [Botrytis porri]